MRIENIEHTELKNVVLPTESVYYPIWDFVNRHKVDETYAEIPFENGSVTLENKSKRFNGLPSKLDFEIYMALMRWFNQSFVRSGSYPNKMVFKLSELRERIYNGSGGKQNSDLIMRLDRLYMTVVRTDVKIDSRNKFLAVFSLISEFQHVVKDGEHWCKVVFPEYFIFQPFLSQGNQNFLSLEAEKLDKIKSVSSKLAYAKLVSSIQSAKKNRKNKITRIYTRLIEKIFTGWKVESVVSKVKQQLKNTLEDLKEAGAIKDWDIYKGQKWDSKGNPLPALKKDGILRIDLFLGQPNQENALKTQKKTPSQDFKDQGKDNGLAAPERSILDEFRKRVAESKRNSN